MIAVFALIVVSIGLWTLRDEFRPGGSLLNLQADPVAHIDGDGELIELPVVGTWTEDELLLTVAEISALGSINLDHLRETA